MTSTSPVTARRHCLEALNAVHSAVYFTHDLAEELGRYGVVDPSAVYLVGRFAPLGAVGPGAVTAVANSYAPALVTRHLPGAWAQVAPAQALECRLRAVGALSARLLDGDRDAAAAREAAALAVAAARACPRPARPLAAANLDATVPDAPHLALWHAATVLREFRGDGHVVALAHAELTGLDSLVIDCARPEGMPESVVREKRGWSREDWAAAGSRLVDRGLLDRDGRLTERGSRVRAAVEDETDRLDRLPYDALGTAATARLTELVGALVARMARLFPDDLRSIFVPASVGGTR